MQSVNSPIGSGVVVMSLSRSGVINLAHHQRAARPPRECGPVRIHQECGEGGRKPVESENQSQDLTLPRKMTWRRAGEAPSWIGRGVPAVRDATGHGPRCSPRRSRHRATGSARRPRPARRWHSVFGCRWRRPLPGRGVGLIGGQSTPARVGLRSVAPHLRRRKAGSRARPGRRRLVIAEARTAREMLSRRRWP